MAHIISINGITPKIGRNCFLAETAVIIGDVVIGDNCSIWYGAVLRGDVNSIRIGNGVNIQDNAVLHTLYQKSVVTIGDHVSIGHNATVHGADVQAHSLIGMGATLLDNAVIEECSIVAAGALVLANARVEAGCIYAGVPAKFVKKLTPQQAREINERTARDYQMYASWFMAPEAHSTTLNRTE